MSFANDAAVAGHRSDQMVKLQLDCVEVAEYICVIVFEVVQYQCSRMVVNKLGSLVEKGSIVFISLHDEIFGISNSSGFVKI